MKIPTAKQLKQTCSVGVMIRTSDLEIKLIKNGCLLYEPRKPSHNPIFYITVPSFNLGGLAFRQDFTLEHTDEEVYKTLNNEWVITHLGSGMNVIQTHEGAIQKYSKKELWLIFEKLTAHKTWELSKKVSKKELKEMSDLLKSILKEIEQNRSEKVS